MDCYPVKLLAMILLTALVSVPSAMPSETTSTRVPSLIAVETLNSGDGIAVGTGKEAPVFITARAGVEGSSRLQSPERSETPLAVNPFTILVRRSSPLTQNAPDPITVNPEPPARNITQLIYAASLRYGVEHDLLLRVAWCESKFNPAAVNRTSGASGVFQMLGTTWSANSVRYGWGGASVFDSEANVNVASAMIAGGNIGAWEASKKCWG